MAAMSRRRFVALVSGLALVSLGVVAGLAVLLVTQTGYGRDKVRDLLVSRVKAAVHGTMYVGEISGGLFGGVVVDSLEIRDQEDSLLLASGPVRLRYDPRDLVDKRLLFSDVELVRPIFHARRHENGEWNFRRVFPGDGKKRGPRSLNRGFGDYIVARSVRVTDGQFILTMPWHPADSLRGAKRDSSIRVHLSSTEHEYRTTREGFAQTRRWTDIDAVSPYVRIADPDSGGKQFVVSRLSFRESDPFFLFNDVRGAVTVIGDSAWLDVPRFELPGSVGSAKGKVVWGSHLPIRYAVDVSTEKFALNDVAWVYPTMPRTGGGKTQLRIRNDRRNLNIIEYQLSKMDVHTTGSHLTGAMTFAVGGPILAVRDVDVVATPVDFALIRQFNGKPFPVAWRGTVTGTLKARGGPLDRFRVDDARLVFRDANVPGAEMRAVAEGELDILYPAFTVFRGLKVAVAHGDLRTVQFLYPNFPRLRGIVSGAATLDSSWLDVRFSNADVTYTDGPGEQTRVTGLGRITYGEEFMTYDVDLDAQSLSLTGLALSYPLLPVRGLVRGPIRARGTMDALDVTTTLAGSAGTLAFDGRLDAYPPGYAIRGRTSVTNLDLRVLLERADVPATDLTARFDTDVTADSLANLRGRIVAAVSSGSIVDGIRIYGGSARLLASDGVLRADTLSLETSAATVFASGGIGLAAGASDSMRVAIFVDSLGGLRRWIRARSPADSLDGSLAISGVLTGSVRSLDARGRIVGNALYSDGNRVDSLGASFTVRNLTGAAAGELTATIADASAGGIPIARIDARVRMDAGNHLRGSLVARGRSGQSGHLGGEVWLRGDTMDARIDTLTLAVDSTRARKPVRWSLVQPFDVRSTRDALTLSALRLEDGFGGRVALRATLPVSAPIDASLVAERMPLSDVTALAQLPVPMKGIASARLAVAGMRSSPTMEWSAVLQQVASGAVAVDRVDAQGTYAERRFDGSARLFRGDWPALTAALSLPVDLALLPREERMLDEPLRGSIRADSADLAILETFIPELKISAGRIVVAAELGGTWLRPTIDGHIGVTGGVAVLGSLGVQTRQIEASVTMRGDSLALDRFSAVSDGGPDRGSLGMRGFLDLDVLHHAPGTKRTELDPKFSLDIDARGFHVINQRNVGDLRVSTRGLRLAGSLARSTLTGTVVVDKGVVFIPELARKRLIDLNDPDFYQLVDTSVYANRSLLPDAPTNLIENLSLQNVRLVIGPEVWIRSSEANIQLGGEVGVTKGRDPRVAARDTAPMQLALQGTLTADRGQYRLVLGQALHRTFDVTRGRLTFAGDPDLNPTLDISAVHTVRTQNNQDIRVRVGIRGTLAQPELVLSSDEGQAISQTDLVSYLAFGKPAFELVGAGSERTANLTAGLFASTAGGLVESVLQRQFGSTVDVFRVQTGVTGDYAANTTGTGLRESAFSTIGSTRVTFGKQLNERTFVGLDAGLCELTPGQGGSSNQTSALAAFRNRLGLKVDHRLAHGFSVSAGYEPSASDKQCLPGNTAGQLATQAPRQIGLDLFRNWSF